MALRLFGFVLILSLLGLSGYAALDKARSGELNPVKSISAAEQATELASARYVLGVVSSHLERVKTVSGTYDNDLDLHAFPLVRLVQADEHAYCLEFQKTATFALRGPGGATVVGTC